MTYGTYFVAHIDVLGQGEEMLKLESLPATAENYKSAVEALRRTAGRVSFIRDIFREFFTGLAQRRLSPDSLPPGAREQFIKFRSLRFGLQAFSDSIVVFVPLMTDPELGNAKASEGLWVAMMAVANLMLMALSAGIPVRGGLDVGNGLDMREDEIYGPVLVRAYRLESQTADYHRAPVGEGLLRYLSWLDGQVDPGRWGTFSAERAAECRKIICNAPDDGVPMLHIVSPEVLRLGPHHHELPPKVVAWAATERARFRAERNDRLERRYERLLGYLGAFGHASVTAV